MQFILPSEATESPLGEKGLNSTLIEVYGKKIIQKVKKEKWTLFQSKYIIRDIRCQKVTEIHWHIKWRDVLHKKKQTRKKTQARYKSNGKLPLERCMHESRPLQPFRTRFHLPKIKLAIQKVYADVYFFWLSLIWKILKTLLVWMHFFYCICKKNSLRNCTTICDKVKTLNKIDLGGIFLKSCN